MTTVNIPDEAKSAGWEALRDAQSENAELVQAYARALRAAAPLIVAAELKRLAAQYPTYVFPETADEIARCAAAGITLDGIQALAIRERLLTEAKRLEGEQE